MQMSLLEVLRQIPDRRRAEGKRFDLATVLFYAILSMVAGANSYRQMHEFIPVSYTHLDVYKRQVEFIEHYISGYRK